MVNKRRFKKSSFRTSDTREVFTLFEPTGMVKGSVLVSDKFQTRTRMKFGGLESGFAVKKRKRR